MSSPNIAIQAALMNTIKALATDAAGRVYAVVPQSPTYPYAVVWPGFEIPIDEECFDRSESTMQVDVWADTVSYLSVKSISGAIREALHEQTLAVSGHVVDRIRIESINYSEEPPRYRARISIVVETQPA